MAASPGVCVVLQSHVEGSNPNPPVVPKALYDDVQVFSQNARDTAPSPSNAGNAGHNGCLRITP